MHSKNGVEVSQEEEERRQDCQRRSREETETGTREGKCTVVDAVHENHHDTHAAVNKKQLKEDAVADDDDGDGNHVHAVDDEEERERRRKKEVKVRLESSILVMNETEFSVSGSSDHPLMTLLLLLLLLSRLTSEFIQSTQHDFPLATFSSECYYGKTSLTLPFVGNKQQYGVLIMHNNYKKETKLTTSFTVRSDTSIK